MAENQTKQNSQPTAEKHTSKLKIALIIVGLLFVILAAKVVLILTGKPTIKTNYVAELNRISKPANYDPNHNAVFDYKKAIAVVVEMPEELPSPSRAWLSDMNEIERGILKSWVGSCGKAPEHVRRGSTKRYCWIENVYEDNNLTGRPLGLHGGRIRQLAWLIQWHAQLEAMDGRINSALDDIITAYRLGSHLMGPKPTAYQLMGIAIKALSIQTAFVILDKDQLDGETLKDFQRRIQDNIDQNKKEFDFQCEKLMMYDFIQRVFTDNGKDNGHLIPGQILVFQIPENQKTKDMLAVEGKWRPRQYAKAIWLAITGPDRRRTVQMADKLFAYCDNIKHQTSWKLHNKGIDPAKQIKDMTRSYRTLRASHRYYRTIRAYQAYMTSESALITTIAILRYKTETVRLPETLDQLVATGYLKELPMDPYSDGPLVYRRLDDGFTLYSFGPDFDDDGGTPSLWDRGYQGGDQVFWPVQ